MKRLILFTVAALLSTLFSVGIGLGEENKKVPNLAKPVAESAKMFDANNLAMWVLNNGNFASNPQTGQPGLYYPKGQMSKTLIYTSGLILGAYIDDSLHTMVNCYESDAASGAVAANGEPYGLEDPAFRVYKINAGDTPASNPDYAEWPREQGAPVNPDGTPKIMGDQMLWCCYTDAYPELHTNSLTAPLKAEVHFSVWGWRQLQNLIFLKWEISNRNNKPWRNTLVGIFCDPDLGDANDDAIGSDTTLQMVYCYNGDAIDNYGYGDTPPAVGYVFLQPPQVTLPGSSTPSPVRTFSPIIIKSSPGDWGDISLQSPFTAMKAYNRMQALSTNGEEMIDPVANLRAYWAYTGDPLFGSGWIDTNYKDRRMMLSAGPFDLQFGEKQELVMAIVVGQGEDHLSSIPQAKKTAGTAQVFYHNNFTFSRLQKPQLTGSCIEERMLLSWTDVSVDYEEQANASAFAQAYQFEGYVLMQSEYGYDNWQPVAVCDRANQILQVKNIFYENGEVRVNTIPGRNAGVQLSLVLGKDPLHDCFFYLGKSYYFGVCAYVVNKDLTPQFFTSDTSFLTIVPQHLPLNVEIVQVPGDTLQLEYNGTIMPDNFPIVQIAEPSLITGDRYRISFDQLDTSLTWSLVDVTKIDTLLKDIPLNSSEDIPYVEKDKFNPIIDGITIRAQYQQHGIKDIVELTENGTIGDFNLWRNTNSYGSSHGWPLFSIYHELFYFSVSDLDRYRQMGNEWYEFRFVADSSLVWNFKTGNLLATRVPFQIFQIDRETQQEIRLCPLVWDRNHDGKWSRTFAETIRGIAFEPIYYYKDIVYRAEDEGVYLQTNDGTIAPGFDLTKNPTLTGFCFLMNHMSSYSGFPVDSNGVYWGPPATGERILIRTFKPLQASDVFEFETTAPIHYSQLERSRLKEITVFPNPYPGSNQWVTDPYDHYVTFGNLPGKCKIQIFSLSGDLVALLEHEDGTPFQRWDLRNNRGDLHIPVASGIYIARIDVPGVGERIIKLAILQTEPVIVK